MTPTYPHFWPALDAGFLFFSDSARTLAASPVAIPLGGIAVSPAFGRYPMSDRVIVDWRGLKAMGWPYSRAHTWRMMEAKDDPFPRCFKLRKHRNSHPVWRVREVLAYFEAHGLKVTEDWNTPE